LSTGRRAGIAVLVQQGCNCGCVEARNLVSIDDKHKNLAIAVGLRESQPTGHEDLAYEATGCDIDHGDGSFDLAVGAGLRG
jgi:hypothetical protein